MISIVFKQDIPDNYRKHIETMIRRYELLLPVWLQEVMVFWKDKEGEYASMDLLNEYRQLKLTIDRGLMEMPLKFQRETFLHEFAHCFNASISDVATEILDMFYPNGVDDEDENAVRVYNLLSWRIEEVRERVNSDFTFSIARFEESLRGPEK
jgi:hypothetical protein